MSAYLQFLRRCFSLSFQGDWRYHAWMLTLTVLVLVGLNAWAKQLVFGLHSTGMTDQVAWGLYISNFVYLVGVAAAAVMLVIPVYLYGNRELKDLVVFGELLAVAAIVMCLAFVTVDLGRPDRVVNMFRNMNFPNSILSWDVIVLSGYLLLNLHICGYLIYSIYRGQKPTRKFYIPFVIVAIGWAISIHTVTAFLFVGLGARPFWNTAILAPRFLASAFAAGPAIIILTLQLIKRYAHYEVSDQALKILRNITTVALTINLFLWFSEAFTEFYTDSAHLVSTTYLYFGLGESSALVPWIWTALFMDSAALVILYLPASRRLRYMNLACVLIVLGIWIEKGMGLIVPGQVPTPLGEVIKYTPTWNETLVVIGVWALGLMLYTIFVRITVPVLTGELSAAPRASDLEA